MSTRTRLLSCLLAIGVLLITACETAEGPRSTPAQATRSPSKAGQQTIEEPRWIEAHLSDFADDFVGRLGEATEYVDATALSTEGRQVVHELRYSSAQSAWLIATANNPRVGLLDMLVFLSLQGTLIERNLIPDPLGPAGPDIAAVFRASELDLRRFAATLIDSSVLDELDELTAQWLATHGDRRYAAYVRLEDFAQDRSMVRLGKQSRGLSVLRLVALDPMAGLDPTTREIERTRRLAERTIYYGQRLPLLIRWQAELLYIDTMMEPELKELMADIDSLSNSFAELGADVGNLTRELPDLVAREREAAVEQVFSRIADERHMLLDDIAAREEGLTRTLADLRGTIESGQQLSETTLQLAQATDALVARFERDPEGSGEPLPPASVRYLNLIEQGQTLAQDLNALVGSVNALAEEKKNLTAAADDIETRTETIVDHAFRRVLLAGGILIGLAFVLQLVLRFIPGRQPATKP